MPVNIQSRIKGLIHLFTHSYHINQCTVKTSAFNSELGQVLQKFLFKASEVEIFSSLPEEKGKLIWDLADVHI